MNGGIPGMGGARTTEISVDQRGSMEHTWQKVRHRETSWHWWHLNLLWHHHLFVFRQRCAKFFLEKGAIDGENSKKTGDRSNEREKCLRLDG